MINRSQKKFTQKVLTFGFSDWINYLDQFKKEKEVKKKIHVIKNDYMYNFYYNHRKLFFNL